MRVRARVEWPGRPPLTNVTIDLQETSDDWSAAFSLPVKDLPHVNPDADEILITLEDGRSGKALLRSFHVDADGGDVQLEAAGPLRRSVSG